jgi:hypothetical protein
MRRASLKDGKAKVGYEKPTNHRLQLLTAGKRFGIHACAATDGRIWEPRERE